MKILIVKLGAIGDVLRTTSILPGLRKKYPDSLIDWLTASSASDLLIENPYLNRVIIWDKHQELDNFYDLVIGLEDDQAVCQFISTLRHKEILGAYYSDKRVIYTPSAWFDMSIISRFGLAEANQLKKANQKSYQQHLAELLGIGISPYVFKLHPDEIKWGKEYVASLGFSSGEKILGVNTGAGLRWPQKSWGIEQTIDLINRVKKELGIPAMILGGDQEAERNQLIAKETGMPKAKPQVLRRFGAVINQCHSLLSSDSLAMHFGIATWKHLTVFFGPTSAAEIELYNLGAKLAPPLPCLVCYKKSCSIHPNCMESLKVETVFEAVKKGYQ
ncbi:hypothetical protein A2311_00505 [candidate division WOR-1 bacterium RIFOXYB2_FULL_48_7]|uniref:Heptosyltransferase n=1 Tax=candidate division WOR-1 bacterium RIFOXYB2_FULL_48_7 TaxID=1802583 RepID=A0A1F4TTT4_UNCSA|nr:MAG: hypothetical protein A2311_00505 [candidate division WOR-1 bacterium RIFOXYB2_FULL_48_7]